jgi:hypothetical protein
MTSSGLYVAGAFNSAGGAAADSVAITQWLLRNLAHKGGLYRSDNDGRTWRQLLPDRCDDVEISPDCQRAYALGPGIATPSPGTEVIGAEPQNANDAYLSLKASRIIPAIHADTVAEAVRAVPAETGLLNDIEG